MWDYILFWMAKELANFTMLVIFLLAFLGIACLVAIWKRNQ